mmetsp:Transcript_12871/g.36420  ORF Transcript_12871/g.36420 Transcript_12871/m.36420 type:complete len:493 (+) Transcript_12871:178-1656(+)
MAAEDEKFPSNPPVLVPSKELQKESLEHFCPLIYVHSEEEFPPCSIDFYLKGVKMVYKKKLKGTFGRKKIECVDVLEVGKCNRDTISNVKFDGDRIPCSKFEDLQYKCPRVQLKIVDERVKYGEVEMVNGKKVIRAPLYGHFALPKVDDEGVESPPYFDLVYTIFNGYNGACMNDPGFIGIHEADWEHITIRVTPDLKRIIAVKFKAHRERDIFTRWHFRPSSEVADEIEYEVDRPSGRVVAYSAKSGHGFYAHAGKHSYGFVRGADLCDKGILWDPIKDSRVEVFGFEDSWTYYCGKWGDKGPIRSIWVFMCYRDMGGPTPLKVLECNIGNWDSADRWKLLESGRSWVASGTGKEDTQMCSKKFTLNNRGRNCVWKIWDENKKPLKDAQFTLYRKGNKQSNSVIFDMVRFGDVSQGVLTFHPSRTKMFVGGLFTTTPEKPAIKKFYVTIEITKKEENLTPRGGNLDEDFEDDLCTSGEEDDLEVASIQNAM